jgi:hypothetical protein
MDATLTAQAFTNIFENSIPSIISNVPKISFDSCITDFKVPYLSVEEKECIKSLTKKYLYSMDYSLIYFSKKLIK